MPISLFRLHMIECSGVRLLVSGRSSSQLLQTPLALLQANSSFQSSQVQARLPDFQDRLSFCGWVVGLHHRLEEAVCRSGSIASIKPFHSPGLCPHLMVYPLHKNWGFYVFISWQMQASHHVICCRCCTQVSRWHISNSKQKNKGVSAFRTITRSRENLQCYCYISAFPLVEENYSL